MKATTSKLKPLLKSQNIRILDVLVLGPFMIYLAGKNTWTKKDKALLALLGVGTMGYNYINFMKYRRLEKQGIALTEGAINNGIV